ncbi:MAG: N-acetylmuramoyl-L-alanine amidase [Ruminococcaceae bacterium]|nr:N-acetylmuramoyl-L-alanine amidase [Oscillospiraceae bacterium]MBE6973371.1 N-acetylmuramoyl-L-alanine amidase [Oscillospiraceae bacterium]
MCKQRRKIVWRLLVALLIFFLCVRCGEVWYEVVMTQRIDSPALILDAGHGGEDGGAVSLSGEKESVINLEITLRLDQMLGLLGECPLMLRQEDVSLHNSSAVTLREKKVSDLKKRATIVNANPTAVLVSIHQNSYSESKYQGAQTFYASTSGSRELADAVQCALRDLLQPQNTRQVKQIPKSVYLLNHVENRAILIECGFLSNPEEEQLLQQTDYQKKLAMVLAPVLSA